MFRVLEFGPSGGAVVSVGTEQVAPPPEGVLRWIDLQGQDPEQLARLRERFGFHPLALEDCAHFDQRPKFEDYWDHAFIVTQGFARSAADPRELEILELHTFLGQRYLVTIHAEPIAAIEQVWQRLQRDPDLARRGADFIYYQVADGIVDALFPLLDQITDELDQVEDAVLDRFTPEGLTNIFHLKRQLVTLRKVLSPQRDVFALLARGGSGRIGERTAFYFRDVHDHLMRINESVEMARDLLGNALDAYLWMVSNRTNEIMKRLAILGTIFLPLTFITGFFGQNFELMPFRSRWLFLTMLVACIVVPSAMVYFFVRRRWY